jgi:CBS domain-containing protein
MMKTVSDILEAKGHEVATVKPDDTVLHALEVMAEKNIGACL